jgi:hypothetical protein
MSLSVKRDKMSLTGILGVTEEEVTFCGKKLIEMGP